jgi:hypothetical protein
MKDSKRSKLEIISIFDLPLIFCVELEFERLKRSDSSGIRKLTSISFSIYMGKKKKREHGNCSLQRQISHSANVDLCPFRLEYLELFLK